VYRSRLDLVSNFQIDEKGIVSKGFIDDEISAVTEDYDYSVSTQN
jgi:hypothetical protein